MPYYRIKAKLKDGKILYSPVKYVSVQQENIRLSIAPNPVINGRFVITTAETGHKKAAIYDVNGKLILRFEFDGLYKELNPDLPKGNYYLKIITDNQKTVSSTIVVL